MSTDIERPRSTFYFGACPSCGSPGLLSWVDTENWMSCPSCKVRWCIGSGLFTPPDYQDEEAEERFLDEYREVPLDEATPPRN